MRMKQEETWKQANLPASLQMDLRMKFASVITRRCDDSESWHECTEAVVEQSSEDCVTTAWQECQEVQWYDCASYQEGN